MQCHRNDREHRIILCPDKCSLLCKEGLHPCKKSYGEPCGDCKVRMEKIRPCAINVHCHENPDDVKCISRCKQRSEFDHLCVKKCYQKCHPCMSQIEKVMPGCSHVQKLPCSIDPDHALCQHRCKKKCEIGHN